MENKDIKFLNKNMQKLLRLKQTTTKHYNKTNFKKIGYLDYLKVLILYILKDIEIIDIKKIILEEVINYEIETTNCLEQLYEEIYPEGYYSD